jgi:lipid-binding SYLF domain-containing protein
MSAEMLSYSRAQGVFAGVSLSGATLGPDSGANENIYGKKISPGDIVDGKVPAPASAKELLAILESKSPKNVSASK